MLVLAGTGHFGVARYVASSAFIDDAVYAYDDPSCKHALKVLRASDAPPGADFDATRTKSVQLGVVPRDRVVVLVLRNDISYSAVRLTISDKRWPLTQPVVRVHRTAPVISQYSAFGYIAFNAHGVMSLTPRQRFRCGLTGVPVVRSR